MTKKQPLPKRGATPIAPKKVRKPWRWPRIKIPAQFWVGMLVMVVMVSIGVGGYWGLQRWKINQVVVTGRLHVWQADELAQHIAWVKGQNFISLDVDAVRQKLQKLPLMAQLIVRKQWPNILSVDVTEDVPVALWNGNKILSASGRLSAVPQSLNTDGLIKIHGAQQRVEQATRYYRRIQQALNELDVHIVDLTVTAVDSVRVQLSNGWQVEFGRQYLDDRIVRLKYILQTIPASKISKIDLRYGKGAAISWRTQQEIG